jgi:cytochrome c oxidase assembly protein subunit 15
MSHSVHNSWLHRFAVLTALSTLLLIAIGGLVTSHGVGMSVPDWPTSYGYNMFRFPISKWVGGIFYEHTHRLMATIVGVLVVALTRWLGGRGACKPLLIVGLLEMAAGFVLLRISPRLGGAGYFLSGIGMVVLLAGMIWIKNAPASAVLRKLGWFAFVLVQLQGLLGGLRVVLFNDQIGIFHAALAQAFLVLLVSIALFTGQWWRNLPARVTPIADALNLRGFLLLGAFLIFGQLLIGATMRHQHAGLSIPDFPLAYGKLWPAVDSVSIASYNAHRTEVTAVNPITAFQVVLQMVHRLIALMILCVVAFSAWTARRQLGARHPLAKLAITWLVLILCQVLLGAATIWSDKAADIATGHVVVGALSLVCGALLTIISFRVLMPIRVAALAADKPAEIPFVSGKPAASSAK